MEIYMEKEIEDAINAANDALYYLEIAEEKLNSAKKWGVVDLFGGGFFISMFKTGKMKEAQNALNVAQDALQILRKELLDLGENISQFDLGGVGLAIFDVAFDNFFADILAQQKINNALANVKNLIAQVEGILDALSTIHL